jgi:hypothetical protein
MMTRPPHSRGRAEHFEFPVDCGDGSIRPVLRLCVQPLQLEPLNRGYGDLPNVCGSEVPDQRINAVRDRAGASQSRYLPSIPECRWFVFELGVGVRELLEGRDPVVIGC